MQFGEWLREELKEGGTLSSQEDPDISILLRKARFHHTVLFGPALDQWAPKFLIKNYGKQCLILIPKL